MILSFLKDVSILDNDIVTTFFFWQLVLLPDLAPVFGIKINFYLFIYLFFMLALMKETKNERFGWN